MPFSFETFIVLLILLALCAISLVKFHASWQPFFESVHTLFVDLVRDFRNIDWEAEAAKEAADLEPFQISLHCSTDFDSQLSAVLFADEMAGRYHHGR